MQIIAVYVGEHPLRPRGLRRRSCPAPTRRWPPWSATSCASTRCPARCRRSRSRTWSPPATSPWSPSGWRWCTRIAREIEDYVLELGSDGRLLSLQLDELVTGVDIERELVIRDYLPDRPPQAHPRGRADRPGDARPRPSSSTSPPSPGPWASAPASTSTPRSPRAATGCWPRSRGCPAPSSTGWSSTSAACRSCSPPASTTSRPSTASASSGPAASARDCPGSPSPASSSATSEPARLRRQCRADGSCRRPDVLRLGFFVGDALGEDVPDAFEDGFSTGSGSR